MHLGDATVPVEGTLEEERFDAESSRAGGNMTARKNCAYNQTRECFLGLEIDAAEYANAHLKLPGALAMKSGEGLWLTPFRGIPEENIPAPIDLIYLDDQYRVLDVVESFPTFRATAASGPRASSVLVLPAHSIYSSQTQPGDQLVICVAEEMERRLEQIYGTGGVVQSAVLLREKPLWSGGPGVLQLKERDEQQKPEAQQTMEMDLLEPGIKTVRPPKNWLQRWWSPDPRKAPREQAPGLAAYYWNGGAPQAHEIKDISSTGLYVVTEERWYPGTLILMTLQKTENGEVNTERSIFVHTRAVRWGKDGVGLQFVLPAGSARDAAGQLVSGTDRRELEMFLRQLNKIKR
jgi:hypothetical protein